MYSFETEIVYSGRGLLLFIGMQIILGKFSFAPVPGLGPTRLNSPGCPAAVPKLRNGHQVPLNSGYI